MGPADESLELRKRDEGLDGVSWAPWYQSAHFIHDAIIRWLLYFPNPVEASLHGGKTSSARYRALYQTEVRRQLSHVATPWLSCEKLRLLASPPSSRECLQSKQYILVVVKIMVPLWVPIIIRHLIFRVSKKGPSF